MNRYQWTVHWQKGARVICVVDMEINLWHSFEFLPVLVGYFFSKTDLYWKAEYPAFPSWKITESENEPLGPSSPSSDPAAPHQLHHSTECHVQALLNPSRDGDSTPPWAAIPVKFFVKIQKWYFKQCFQPVFGEGEGPPLRWIPRPVLPSQVCLCAGQGSLPRTLPSCSSPVSPSRNHQAANNKSHLRTQNAAAVEAWSRVAVIFQQNDFFSRSDTNTPPPDSLETEAALLGSRRILRTLPALLCSCSPPGSHQGPLQTRLWPLPTPEHAPPHAGNASAPTRSVSSWIFKFQIFPVLKTRHAAQRGWSRLILSSFFPNTLFHFFPCSTDNSWLVQLC